LDPTAPRVRFGAFVLDRETRQLRRGEAPQPLKPQAYELLDFLIARRPAAVSKQEIRDRLWPDTFVSESTLSSLAAQVRRALGREGAHAVRTVHGFGYAFEAEATEEARGRQESRIAGYVAWNRRTLVLVAGENVIGRDADVQIRIEAPGVSRRHARILAEGGRFTLEDLGSKNGTFLRDVRLAHPAEIEDGDVFRLGQTLVVFHRLEEGAPTATEG
jgi:DNA-binding winged helix-turn-helix (wHTH) protein